MLRLDFIKGLFGIGAVSVLHPQRLLQQEVLPYHALVCEIAGFQYYDGHRLFDSMRVGDYLSLVREPNNEFDRSAIALYYRGHKIGFIPRRYNRVISNMLDDGFNGFRCVIDYLDTDDYYGEFYTVGIKVLASIPVA